MSRLHDTEPEVQTIELDMDAIYREAHSKPYSLEFDSGGVVFKWAGKALSAAAAELKARQELSDLSHLFSRYGARLVAIEVLTAS